jgi:hypothetical protein
MGSDGRGKKTRRQERRLSIVTQLFELTGRWLVFNELVTHENAVDYININFPVIYACIKCRDLYWVYCGTEISNLSIVHGSLRPK